MSEPRNFWWLRVVGIFRFHTVPWSQESTLAMFKVQVLRPCDRALRMSDVDP